MRRMPALGREPGNLLQPGALCARCLRWTTCVTNASARKCRQGVLHRSASHGGTSTEASGWTREGQQQDQEAPREHYVPKDRALGVTTKETPNRFPQRPTQRWPLRENAGGCCR